MTVMIFREKETWEKYREVWEKHKANIMEYSQDYTEILNLILNYKIGYDKYIPCNLSQRIFIINSPIIDLGDPSNELGYGVDEVLLYNLVTDDYLLDYSYELGDCGGYLNHLYVNGNDYTEEFMGYGYYYISDYVSKKSKEIYQQYEINKKIILYEYKIDYKRNKNFVLEGFNSNWINKFTFINWMYLDLFIQKLQMRNYRDGELLSATWEEREISDIF